MAPLSMKHLLNQGFMTQPSSTLNVQVLRLRTMRDHAGTTGTMRGTMREVALLPCGREREECSELAGGGGAAMVIPCGPAAGGMRSPTPKWSSTIMTVITRQPPSCSSGRRREHEGPPRCEACELIDAVRVAHEPPLRSSSANCSSAWMRRRAERPREMGAPTVEGVGLSHAVRSAHDLHGDVLGHATCLLSVPKHRAGRSEGDAKRPAPRDHRRCSSRPAQCGADCGKIRPETETLAHTTKVRSVT